MSGARQHAARRRLAPYVVLPFVLALAPLLRAPGSVALAQATLPPAPPVTLEDSLALVLPEVRLALPVPAACPVASLWANLEWQWRAVPTVMIDAVRRLADARAPGEAEALARVVAAQRDPIVAHRFESCHDASPALFWRLALTAAGAHAAPLERCLSDLDWQRGAWPASLRDARRQLDASDASDAEGAHDAATGSAGTDPLATAMAILLAGQAHNARALERYRACFRDAPEVMWSAVRARTTGGRARER